MLTGAAVVRTRCVLVDAKVEAATAEVGGTVETVTEKEEGNAVWGLLMGAAGVEPSTAAIVEALCVLVLVLVVMAIGTGVNTCPGRKGGSSIRSVANMAVML